MSIKNQEDAIQNSVKPPLPPLTSQNSTRNIIPKRGILEKGKRPKNQDLNRFTDDV
jgi:hypothetical protein